MRKTMYFQVSPEVFKMYDRISREGKVKFRKASTFDMADPFYNKLIFVGKQKKLKGRITVKEQVTGTKFIIKIVPQEDNTLKMVLYSNRLELRTHEPIPVDTAIMKQKEASGFYYSFRPVLTDDEPTNIRLAEEAEQTKKAYVENVLGFFADAKVTSKNYRNDISMQDKQIQRNLKQLSRRLR